MTILAFDCAISGLSVALVRDGQTWRCIARRGVVRHATLLPAIAALLQEAGVDRRALSMIAVTIGPGSFTGVRVGLAAARGLAIALGVPVAGITTTGALLAQVEPDDRLAVAAIDTISGDWFCALGEGDRSPFLASTETLAARLAGSTRARSSVPQATAWHPCWHRQRRSRLA
jgi:tRNA threonylcarbamoyladenosine biosynthesis protein TsaB